MPRHEAGPTNRTWGEWSWRGESCLRSRICFFALQEIKATIYSELIIFRLYEAAARMRGLDFTGKEFQSKVSGNEVDRTNAFLLLIAIVPCFTLHCQKDLRLKLFYRIRVNINTAAMSPPPTRSELFTLFQKWGFPLKTKVSTFVCRGNRHSWNRGN